MTSALCAVLQMPAMFDKIGKESKDLLGKVRVPSGVARAMLAHCT